MEIVGSQRARPTPALNWSGPADVQGQRKVRNRARRALPYLLLVPTFGVLGALVAYPVGDEAYLSLTRTTFIQPQSHFVGLANYASVLGSGIFWQVLVNTLEWTAAVVAFQFVVGMAGALVLVRRFVGRGALRALVLLPWVTPGVIVGMVWTLMYDPYLGFIDEFLGLFGVGHHVAVLSNPSTALIGVIVAAVWKGFPLSTLLYMAAYQSVSAELLEAARVDGAGSWARLVHVTLPQMAPTIRITVLLTTVWTFNYFDLVYIMTGGGPVNDTQIFPTYIYQQAFTNVDYGTAATYGVIAVLVLAAFTVVYLRQLRRSGVFAR